MTYTAPLKDMRFVLRHIAQMDDIAKLPGYGHATPDVVEAVLDEAAKLAQDVWAPSNAVGDKNPPKIANGNVTIHPVIKDAFSKFIAGGWNGLTCAEEYGGQNLPFSLGMAVGEMWQSTNLALSLCSLLTQAGIEAIEKLASEDLKKLYLPKIISGEWTGAMCLTEPQAGTDLAAIRTVAKKNGDHYLMKGQKIFITFGDHDFTPNLIHLVLARVDGLAEGNEGLGLFIVPKFIPDADGTLGRRNDMKAVSLEHKLGLHASPTCVMMYGENEGAVCYLVGKEGEGLRNMFVMMNNARVGVGLQGVAIAEQAYQHALRYAKDRVQSSKMGDKSGTRVPIIEHADVRRMLLTMKANTEASRALTYYAGLMIDKLARTGDKDAGRRLDLLTPLVKAWATDLAAETASTGIQIHGGMGFIEETGAAQYYRDSRILMIYEGTNGIQSNDLVFRKVLRDGGAEAAKFIGEMKELLKTPVQKPSDDLDVIQAELTDGIACLEEATAWLLANAKSNTEAVAAGVVPYLRLFSTVAGGYMMARMARAAHEALFTNDGEADFYNAKIITARFFAEGLLPQVRGLLKPVMGGSKAAVQITNDQF